MIQDVKLGTHGIGTYMYAFAWKNLLILEENHQKVKQCGCGKGCGHKKCGL